MEPVDMAVTNEGLAIEIKNLAVQFADLKATIAAMTNTYVSNDVFNLRLEQIEARMDIIKTEVRDIRRSRWIQNTLSAILGAVLTLLISYFVLNIGKS